MSPIGIDPERAEDYRIILANGDNTYITATRVSYDRSTTPPILTVFRGNIVVGEFVNPMGWYKPESPPIETRQTARVSGGVEDAGWFSPTA